MWQLCTGNTSLYVRNAGCVTKGRGCKMPFFASGATQDPKNWKKDELQRENF